MGGCGIDGANVFVGGEGLQHVGAGAGEEIHDARWEVADGEDFAEEDGGEWLGVGAESDNRVTSGDSWEDHRKEAEEGSVLGSEDADDTHGFGGG